MDNNSSNIDYSKYLIPAGLLIGIFIVGNKLLESLGITKSEEQLRKEKELADALGYNIENGPPSTKSDAEWMLIANTIFNDLRFSSIDDNKDDALYQLKKVQNDTDLYKLILYFGIRTEENFGWPLPPQDLTGFVTGNFSSSRIADLNNDYASKGIYFTW